MKRNRKLYTELPSGLIVPTGTLTSIDKENKSSFFDINNKGTKILELFKESKINLSSNCGLKKIIDDTNILCSSWLSSINGKIDINLLLNSLYLDRIADSILMLSELPISERKRHLEKLKKGSLQLINRTRSVAKDKIWELEFWYQLKQKMSNVFLDENPDILIKWSDTNIGIECKKLYSESHVQNILSNAVHQIEKSIEFGVVAINTDDLVPPDSILQVSNPRHARNFIQNLNTEFINRHDRHFRKYLENQRIISVIVSTSIIIDNKSGEPKFSNATEWTIWTLPDLPTTIDNQIKRLFGFIIN